MLRPVQNDQHCIMENVQEQGGQDLLCRSGGQKMLQSDGCFNGDEEDDDCDEDE